VWPAAGHPGCGWIPAGWPRKNAATTADDRRGREFAVKGARDRWRTMDTHVTDA
jgi:hypothetical protein